MANALSDTIDVASAPNEALERIQLLSEELLGTALSDDGRAIAEAIRRCAAEFGSANADGDADEESGGTPVVLVVEDNPVNQKVVCHMLRRMGFEVELAEDGQRGVDALRGRAFDAVLMDCQMPVMDGYQATRTIRGLDEARASTPIIALTANAMAGDREKCLDAGMDDYLSKPARVDQLREKLLQWVPNCGARLTA